MCAWEWVPERRGLANGIILGAFGFGSFVFGLISRAICNPDNLKPTDMAEDGSLFYNEQIAARVPTLLYTLAGSWAILAAIAILLVRKNPAY